MLQNSEAAATAAALGYLINALFAKIGAPHIGFDAVNQSAQTIFLLTGGILSTGWLYYRLRNEQLKYKSERQHYDDEQLERQRNEDENRNT